MGSVTAAGRHAGGLYGRSFRWLRHPLRAVEAEAHHLREVEQEGEAGETPFIAALGLVFFLVPLAAFMMGLAFLAGWLFG